MYFLLLLFGCLVVYIVSFLLLFLRVALCNISERFCKGRCVRDRLRAVFTECMCIYIVFFIYFFTVCAYALELSTDPRFGFVFEEIF